MSDSRWVVLELSPHADGQDPDLVRRSIQNIVRGSEVFIPAAVTQVGDNRVFQYVVEGYAFIRQDRPDAAFRRLENSRYVQSILLETSRGVRTLATVSSVEVARMRRQVQQEVDQGIDIGDTVLITSGPYKEITGRVIEDIPEATSVQVYVRLLSKEAILTLPRSFLRLLEKRVRPALLDRLPSLHAWTASAKILAAWDLDVRDLGLTYQRWRYFRDLRLKADDLTRIYLASRRLPLDTTPLGRATVRWARLRDLGDRLTMVGQQAHLADHAILVPRALALGLTRWSRLRTWLGQLVGLRPVELLAEPVQAGGLAERAIRYGRLHFYRTAHVGLMRVVEQVGAALARMEERMLDNILIDGFNLVFRCRFAPSLRDLKDKQGRPTGAIYGFLRSLASLQKRFPKASLHVCWDGSSKRRKAAFEGYKANRPVRGSDSFDQVGFLRGILPFVGVTQHWNPDEEADDVIAALVKGPMAEQRNIIVTTDHDLLQLVGRTTILLTPAVGAGKEKLYDEDLVVSEYGVEPAKMPHLRALTGDASDNLPGVFRVPSKILAALVRSYGTVDGIFSSGMPGVSKSQYSKLREAEAKVRMNADLMTLRSDIPVIRTDPNPDKAVAEARLADVDASPDIISVFFGDASGFLKEATWEQGM